MLILHYYNADAFEVLESVNRVDLALIDGVKANYLDFLKAVYPKMKEGSIVLIDNSFWRGSFLDSESLLKKESARKIAQLHDYIKNSRDWSAIFIPYLDGLSILRKN